jgi:hypothetical protein
MRFRKIFWWTSGLLFLLSLILFRAQRKLVDSATCQYTANLYEEENEEFRRLSSLPQEEIEVRATALRGERLCKEFIVTTESRLFVEVNKPVDLVYPDGERSRIKGSQRLFLEQGEYRFETVPSLFSPRDYEFRVQSAQRNSSDFAISEYPDSENLDTNSDNSIVESVQPSLSGSNSDGPINWSYGSEKPPFRPADSFPEEQDQYLLKSLKESLSELERQAYPVSDITISLLEFGENGSLYYAGIGDTKQVFPASIVKLFWIVALYGKYDKNLVPEEEVLPTEDEFLMIHESSNDSASRILDLVTNTTSGEKLNGEALNSWINSRYSVNRFFANSGYEWLNVSQKVFPIEYLQMSEPTGRDLQIREHNLKNDKTSFEVSRNYLNTYETLRLLYEIETGKAISDKYSYRIKEFMLHDTSSEAWRDDPFNSIEGFFGEYLPERVQLMTKVGYTQNYGRQEAAIIFDPETDKKFLLVVFANNIEFSSNENKALPKIAKDVFDSVNSRE